MGENRQQQQRHDIGNLDGRVDRRTRGILIGIANGITRHRCLVRLRTLDVAHAILVDETVFEAFLGVIPRTTTRRHGNRHEEAIDDDTEQ